MDRALKMQLNVLLATFYDQSFLSYGIFLESIALFLDKINTQIEEDFVQFLSQDNNF